MATSTARLATSVLLAAVAITTLIPPRLRPTYLPNGHGHELGEGTLLQVKCFTLMKKQHLFKPDNSMWVNILSERPGYHGEVTVTYPGKPGQQDRVDCQYVVNKEGRRCKWTIFDDKEQHMG